jgi:hypothetical protein
MTAKVRTMYEDVYVYSCNTMGTDLPAAEYPASGSFIDVSDFEWCAFLVTAGALDSALTLQVHQAATISGSTKDLTDAKWVIGTGDDNKVGIIEFSPRALDINNGYNYVTLDATGTSGDDTAHIMFLGFGKGSVPVTQSTTQFDTSSITLG